MKSTTNFTPRSSFQFASDSFSINKRSPVGALKAAKMRVRANPVNSSGCLTFAINRPRGESVSRSWGPVILIFQSRFFFARRKIKFSFFFVYFRDGFYSQSRWQGRTGVDVNKM